MAILTFVVCLQHRPQSQVLIRKQANTTGIICAASLLFATHGLCHFPAKNANLPQIDCAASELSRPTGQRIGHNREEN